MSRKVEARVTTYEALALRPELVSPIERAGLPMYPKQAIFFDSRVYSVPNLLWNVTRLSHLHFFRLGFLILGQIMS
jgi:hypothetical protein